MNNCCGRRMYNKYIKIYNKNAIRDRYKAAKISRFVFLGIFLFFLKIKLRKTRLITERRNRKNCFCSRMRLRSSKCFNTNAIWTAKARPRSAYLSSRNFYLLSVLKGINCKTVVLSHKELVRRIVAAEGCMRYAWHVWKDAPPHATSM